jgi:phosphoribosylaminoimidazolecarboxamide formyltransferase / IMP cyclohydrolase
MAFNRVRAVTDQVPLRNILVSTYDKSALAETVRAIAALCPGSCFYATGGTFDVLREALGDRAASRLVAVSDYTGQPEMQGGLVKTLDWKIYLGLLAESGNASHEADLARAGALAFDAVIANLYPFAEAAADSSSGVEDLRQRIDIGGPAMIRAAAKNFLRVASISDPGQYVALLAELKNLEGHTSLAFRKNLAAEAFDRTSRFDELVSRRLAALGAAELEEAYEAD